MAWQIANTLSINGQSLPNQGLVYGIDPLVNLSWDCGWPTPFSLVLFNRWYSKDQYVVLVGYIMYESVKGLGSVEAATI